MENKRGYTFYELLGKGAFSRVYRAEGRDGRRYACKISSNPAMLEREAEIMAGLCHPLFPGFYDFWRNGGRGFLVMESIFGSSLEEMLGRRGGFSSEQIVRTGMELAEGLLYLHDRREKYLFRDVKPANIMIRQDGRIKLLDFGCACSMREKNFSRAGTPGYAAPEQLKEKGELTESCDVYGLGRTLEAMLGRRREGEWQRRGKTAKKICGRLKVILESCMRQQPSERISNMRDVMLLLTALENDGDCVWRQNALCRKNIWESMYKKP